MLILIIIIFFILIFYNIIFPSIYWIYCTILSLLVKVILICIVVMACTTSTDGIHCRSTRWRQSLNTRITHTYPAFLIQHP